MQAWVLPTVVYVLLLGSLGVVSKIALAEVAWPTLIFWTTIGYFVLALGLLSSGKVEFSSGPGTFWSVVTATTAIAGLVALYIALGAGEASKIMPIASVYPLITVLLAAVALSEEISGIRWLGVLVVVIGIALVAVS